MKTALRLAGLVGVMVISGPGCQRPPTHPSARSPDTSSLVWPGAQPPLAFENAAVTEVTVVPQGLARTILEGARQRAPVQAAVRWRTAPLDRGPELMEIYRRCAPAVVVILCGDGSSTGSGWLLSEDGWLLTNHHVARDGDITDALSREVTVVLGRLSSQGHMEPLETRFKAEAYKWDRVSDLALLRLKGVDRARLAELGIRPLRLSTSPVLPGQDVVAIGNAGVTLLWSLKPGVVQAVGHNMIDTPQWLSLWEQRHRTSATQALGGALSEVRLELEKAVGAAGKVTFVQATCPIMAGDSGGPLLNLEGEVVGISTLVITDPKTGGNAGFFVSAVELTEFLRERPASPRAEVPSPWLVDANACELADFDRDGRPETLLCLAATPNEGRVECEPLAMGWDLAGDTDFGPYLVKGSGKRPFAVNTRRLMAEEGMRLQAYLVFHNNTCVAAYDLNHDGFFEVVRLGTRQGLRCTREFVAAAPSRVYEEREVRTQQTVLLPPSDLPLEWRGTYGQVVRATLSAFE